MKQSLIPVLLALAFSWLPTAGATSLDQLDELLTELRDYEYGEPETWKPELIETMRAIYSEPALHPEARETMKQFLESEVSPVARHAVQQQLDLLTPQSAETSTGTDDPMSLALKLMGKQDLSRQQKDQLLRTAETLAANNRGEESRAIYQHLLELGDDLSIRIGALRGLFRLTSDPVAFISNQLEKTSLELRPHVIRLVKELPSETQIGKPLFKAQSLQTPEKIQLMRLLAARRDRSIRPVALKLIEEPPSPLRQESLVALAAVGQEQDVSTLLNIAANEEDPQKKVAAEALQRIPGSAVDGAILRMLKSASETEAVLLIQTLAERNTPNASTLLLDFADNHGGPAGEEALKTLAITASAEDLHNVIDLLIQPHSEQKHKAIEQAVLRISIRHADNPKVLSLLEKKYGEIKDADIVEFLGSVIEKLEQPG